MAMDTLELLIIQPTPFCNIDCDYCYLPARDNKRTMSVETLSAVLEKVFRAPNIGKTLTLVWHAGEPLAAPLAFYEQAHEIVRSTRPATCEVTFSFQSNGILLTPQWCDFLRRSGSRIGLSIDGPAYVQDEQRRYRSGKGTHADAMRGVSLLKDGGVEFHVISVITDVSLPYPTETYEFMKGLGCSAWAFNIEALQGINRRRSFQAAGGDEDLRRFVSRLFATWLDDPNRLHIREFDGLTLALLRGTTTKQEARPFAIVNVDVDGNASTFSPELLGYTTHHGRFTFANLVTEELQAVTDNARYRLVHSEILSGIEKCKASCNYFPLCGGGTPSSKFFETRRFDVARTRYCETQKMILIDEVLGVLERRAGHRLGRTSHDHWRTP
jgi:uncharacterized protein